MKIFVCSVFVLLSMQSVCTSSSSKECEKKLRDIKVNSREFLVPFEKLKQQFNKNMEELKEICTENGQGFANLELKNGSKEADSEAKKFERSFFESYAKSYQLLIGSFLICYQLRDLADEYRCSNAKHFACNLGEKSGCTCSCEEETNNLLCELFIFFDSVGSAGLVVHHLFLQLIESCGKMYQLVRNLGCAQGTRKNGKDECSCSGNGMNSRNLEIEAFILQFTPVYKDAKKGLDSIMEICKQMDSAESLLKKVK